MNSSGAKPAYSRRVVLLTLMTTHVSVTGGGYVVVKLALREFAPAALGFWRLLIGLGGLSIVIWLGRAWPRVEKSDWPRILLLSLVAVPINQLVYLVGMSKTMPSHAALLYGTTAVFALFLSSVLGYERIVRHKIIAIVVALSGLTLVVTRGGNFSLNSDIFIGDLLIFAAVLAWATYTVLGKPLVTKYGAIPSTTCVILVIGTIFSLPFLIEPRARAGLFENHLDRLGWSLLHRHLFDSRRLFCLVQNSQLS